MKDDFRAAADRDVWVQFFAILFIVSGVFSIHHLFRSRQAAPRTAQKAPAAVALGKASSFSKTPGRWVVAPGKRGGADCATLAEAVAAARDGDSILLRPGTYKESVQVAKSVTITGAGDSPDMVTLTFDRSETLAITGGSVVLENLSLSNKGLGNYWALDVSDAILRMSRVKLRSSGSGLRVTDGEVGVFESDLEGRRALFVTGRSSVRVTHSRLAGEEAGISADGGEVNLRVEDCSLKNGRGTGLAAGRFAAVTVSGTVFSGNALAAVSVYSGARVKLTGSSITDNRECGIILDDGGGVILDRVTVRRNKCGVGFNGAGSLEARNSSFSGLKMGAVAIKEGFENAAVIRGSRNTGLAIPYKK